jgi:hypothetical protein
LTIPADGHIFIEDGGEVVFKDGSGNEEWRVKLDASDHLQILDTSGNIRFQIRTGGTIRLHDEAGTAVWEYNPTTNQFRYAPDGVADVMYLGVEGILSDHSAVIVPHIRYVDIGAYTPTGTTTETVATEIISPPNTTEKYSLAVNGMVTLRQVTSTTHRNVDVWLEHSTDGGVGWTSGPVAQVDDMANDEHQRETVAVMTGFEDSAITGDIHVRLRVNVSNTELDIQDSGFTCVLLGTI